MIAQHKLAMSWLWIGVGLCALVLYMAIRPSNGAPPLFPGFDKVMHASVFAVLGSWFAALSVAPKRWPLVALALAAFGAAIEGLQALTGRDPSVWDWVADMVGIAIGITLLRVITGAIMRYIEDRVRTASD